MTSLLKIIYQDKAVTSDTAPYEGLQQMAKAHTVQPLVKPSMQEKNSRHTHGQTSTNHMQQIKAMSINKTCHINNTEATHNVDQYGQYGTENQPPCRNKRPAFEPIQPKKHERKYQPPHQNKPPTSPWLTPDRTPSL
jgi:hypothetical protein